MQSFSMCMFSMCMFLMCMSKGCAMQVHFDCMFKGLNVESTRSARLLGGNRSIAEVLASYC